MGRVPAGHEPDILLLGDLTPSRYTVSLATRSQVQRGKRHQAQCAWSREMSIFVP